MDKRLQKVTKMIINKYPEQVYYNNFSAPYGYFELAKELLGIKQEGFACFVDGRSDLKVEGKSAILTKNGGKPLFSKKCLEVLGLV